MLSLVALIIAQSLSFVILSLPLPRVRDSSSGRSNRGQVRYSILRIFLLLLLFQLTLTPLHHCSILLLRHRLLVIQLPSLCLTLEALLLPFQRRPLILRRRSALQFVSADLDAFFFTCHHHHTRTRKERLSSLNYNVST